jgi:DNA-binding CsgD family transcriptional regulator
MAVTWETSPDDERTVAMFHDVTDQLVNATSFADVAAHVEAALSTVLPEARTTVYLFDSERNVLHPPTEDDGESLGPGDESSIWEAFAGAESLTVGERTILASLGGCGVLLVEPDDIGAFDERALRLVRAVANCATQSLERLRHEAALERREAEFERQSARLKRLHQATRKLLDVEKAVTRSNTRDEMVRSVCEKLTQTDRYSFVWIGSVEKDRSRLVPEAWAGIERGYFDDVDLTLDADATEPSVQAVRTRESVLVSNVSHGLRRAAWRRELLNRGHQSVLSLPLIHAGTLHGVLTVCAGVTDAFDAVSKQIFDEIAEFTAYGIDVIESKQALVTDSVVELEIRCADPSDHFHRLARDVDGTVTFEGIVSGAEPMLYLSVTDAPTDAVLDHLTASASVVHAEHVGDRQERGLFVMNTAEPTIVSWLTDAGAAVTRLTATPTETRFDVELPRSANVRGFIDSLQETYPTAEVLAQRSHERPIESRRTFIATLEERLTDRQLEILKTAYFNGYFEWPRLRTGEEMASLLGITQPTFNNHLRVAERKLFTILFDEGHTVSESV